MPKIFTSEKQKIGETGEEVAAKFLMKRGFSIVERNYTKKWGEIDIVASKEGKIYFVEVKSVTCSTFDHIDRETSYRPEENMHPWKLKRLARTIQTYMLSHKVESDWQVDLALVYLNMSTRKAKVKILSDIVL